MAEQIDELFVKLGLQTDAKQFNEAQNQFDNLKSRALQFGAAIGAGFGLRELTVGFSEATDRMAKFADTFSVAPQFVDELGFAFEQVGGTSDDAYSSIARVADLIEQTEWGEIPIDAFREAGFDPYLLEGVTDIAEAYERIAGATENMDPESARRALSSLGFGNEEIRLFRQGPQALQASMTDARALSQVDQDMIEQAEAFQEASSRISRAMDGVANEISALFVGDLADTINTIADLMAENRDEIAAFAEKALPVLTGIASGIGVLVALRAGRAALGAFANIPGSTALAAGIGFGVQQMITGEGVDVEEGMEESNVKFLQSQAERLRQQIEFGEEAGVSVENLKKELEEVNRLIENRGGEAGVFNNPNADDELSMGPGSVMGGRPGGMRMSYGDINVDARGSNDPAATAAAAERAVDMAMQRASENTITDLRGVVG